MRIMALMILPILIYGTPAYADIYKCTDGKGHVTFSQMPCAPDAKKITVETVQPTEDQAKATSEANNQNRKIIKESRDERGMEAAHKKVQALIDMRDAELNTLRVKKGLAANNLAGATWEKSISDEMQAVNQRYNADIEAARQHVRDLESEKK